MGFKVFPEKVVYDSKRCFTLIRIIRCTSNERKVQKAYQKLFILLKMIVKKNIDNYFFLCYKNNITAQVEEGDLISEAFLILKERCVRDFDMKKNKAFHWYYNQSLSRAFYRSFQKAQKSSSVMYYRDEFQDSITALHGQIDTSFVNLYCERVGCSDQEKRVLLYRMKFGDQNANLERFLQKEGITKARFNEISEDLKEKFDFLRYE